MAGLQQVLLNARRNAVHNPNFKPLPSSTGEHSALEDSRDADVVELADKMLVDFSAEGKLAQPLKPSTARINDDFIDNFISLFRQIIGVTSDKKPPRLVAGGNRRGLGSGCSSCPRRKR